MTVRNGVPRHTVDGAGKVELDLHLPQVLVLIRRKELRWITCGDPADRHGRPWCQLRVDVQHAIDPQFDPLAATDPGNSDAPVAMKTSSSTVAPLR